MARRDDPYEHPGERSRLRTFVLPLAVLLVFVALLSGLVFGGVVQGHAPRVGPQQAPTTRPTMEIAP